MTEVRFGQAINRALIDAMTQDSSIVLFGEDAAEAGGSWRHPRAEKVRRGRVRDTPISSRHRWRRRCAAMTGLWSVVVVMFMTVTLNTDALVNQAAKARPMFGGQSRCRWCVHAAWGNNAGPQHSQCLKPGSAHAGSQSGCPSNVADAYALMRAAIDDDDPVSGSRTRRFTPPKAICRSRRPVAIGWARTRTSGDVTIVPMGRWWRSVPPPPTSWQKKRRRGRSPISAACSHDTRPRCWSRWRAPTGWSSRSRLAFESVPRSSRGWRISVSTSLTARWRASARRSCCRHS